MLSIYMCWRLVDYNTTYATVIAMHLFSLPDRLYIWSHYCQ